MDLNETMLFRWTGYDVEMGTERASKSAPKRSPIPLRPALSHQQREWYVQRLRDAFDPAKGIRVAPYSPHDRVGAMTPVAAPRHALFFTEQTASGSESHWRSYGRMGFGFSKRALFKCGAAPVIYTGGKDSQIEEAIDRLRKHLDSDSRNTRSAAADALELLARHVKVTRLPDKEQNRKPTPKDQSRPKMASRGAVDPTAYPIEQRIRFLAEREWRLIENPKAKRRWHRCENKHLWFRPELGKDLQIVILPDNQTLAMAIDCDAIRDQLISTSRPPVQLLSADVLRKL
jgi:hypothetical protein